jgi:predicted nucleotidyltransferase
MPDRYPDLNDLLRELIYNLQQILRGHFIGAYLQGSFAVGDYDQHSDVDFTIVIDEELAAGQVNALQGMHARLYDLEIRWAQHLEGSYFSRDVLRDLSQRGGELWFLDNGSRALIQSDHCNTAVVRWVMREKGIPLAGPPANTLIPPISAEVLRGEIAETIEEWGQEILDNPDRFSNRFYQGFIVLSHCRMLHSLQTGRVESKVAGAEWAKKNLDPAWIELIDGTWATRPNPALSVRQMADPEAFAKTLEFVQYCIEKSKG